MRLSELYRGEPDEKLLELAADPSSLTDPARQALMDEMLRRGLNLPPEDTSQADEMELVDLVAVRTFEVLGEAVIAKSVLASAGIESILLDEYDQPMDDEMLDLTWFPSRVRASIRLQVNRGDAEAAAEVLGQAAFDQSAASGQEPE